MAEKTPLKYESGEHTPFVPGDTVPAWTLNLAARIQAGDGIQVTPNPDGTITVTNLCCGD